MAILSDQVKRQLETRFAEHLSGPVQLTLYTRPGSGRLILPTGMGCQTCDDARQLAEELHEAAPDLVALKVVDVSAEESDVMQVPTLTLGFPGEEPRIRWQGLTAGYEFATVVDAVERVSTGAHGLSPESVEALDQLTEPVDVMVFATPTCQYCPQAVSLANRMALASPMVTARTVEANEFPDLSRRFGVQGVPRTVVNEQGAFVGALPESRFVASVLELAGVPAEGAAGADQAPA
jgi:glutaredoxin-like protein